MSQEMPTTNRQAAGSLARASRYLFQNHDQKSYMDSENLRMADLLLDGLARLAQAFAAFDEGPDV